MLTKFLLTLMATMAVAFSDMPVLETKSGCHPYYGCGWDPSQPTDETNSATCNWMADGDCDDGGAGAEYALCNSGTDDYDCGRGNFCNPYPCETTNCDDPWWCSNAYPDCSSKTSKDACCAEAQCGWSDGSYSNGYGVNAGTYCYYYGGSAPYNYDACAANYQCCGYVYWG